MRELRTEFDWLGTVLSIPATYRDDCREFAAAERESGCARGAYDVEPESVATVTSRRHRQLPELPAVFDGGSGYRWWPPDPVIIAAVPEWSPGPGTVDSFRVPDAVRDPRSRAAAVDQEGIHVRVYVPYGSQWYIYFVRRLAERPANLTFFLRARQR